MSLTEETVAASQRHQRRSWRGRGVALLVVLATLALVFHRPLFLGNFAAVDPGRVYRSAQPRGEFADTIATHGLASVLNLRGGSPFDAWYVAEVETAEAQGVDFYDLPMRATTRPSRQELLTLLDLFERCRYPLLIHCKSGADRTGLASALYLMTQKGVPPVQALRAFSLAHAHIPLAGPERLHQPIREYDAWLRRRGQSHTPERFQRWVENHYRDVAGDPSEEFVPLAPGPRMPMDLPSALTPGSARGRRTQVRACLHDHKQAAPRPSPSYPRPSKPPTSAEGPAGASPRFAGDDPDQATTSRPLPVLMQYSSCLPPYLDAKLREPRHRAVRDRL